MSTISEQISKAVEQQMEAQRTDLERGALMKHLQSLKVAKMTLTEIVELAREPMVKEYAGEIYLEDLLNGRVATSAGKASGGGTRDTRTADQKNAIYMDVLSSVSHGHSNKKDIVENLTGDNDWTKNNWNAVMKVVLKEHGFLKATGEKASTSYTLTDKGAAVLKSGVFEAPKKARGRAAAKKK